MKANSKFRVLKTWISKDYCIVFQCQNPFTSENATQSKKIHLIIDLKQQSFGLRLSQSKPEDAHANHAFIQILRKQCPQFTIKDVYQTPDESSIVIPLLAGSVENGYWSLLLQKTRPPLISLLSPDATVFVSYGQKGTFTKKHSLPEGLPNLEDTICLNLAPTETPQEEIEALTSSTNELDESRDSGVLFSKAQKELLSRLKRKQKTIKKTYAKILSSMPDKIQISELERNAHLLQSYAYLIKPEMIELKLDPAMTGLDEMISIPLDPDLSKGQMIENTFLKARKLKRSLSFGQQQAQEASEGLILIEADIRDLQGTQKTEAEIQSIIRRYKLPELNTKTFASSKESTHKPYKTYLSSTGHKILVGKGSQENDQLTKEARSNDYWIHAVGAQGSHVIIPTTPAIRSSLPTDLLREAAILAIYFSKLRDDLAGECYVTRKGKIKKQKGMPAGLWNVEQADTIFFRYTTEELQKILQTVQI